MSEEWEDDFNDPIPATVRLSGSERCVCVRTALRFGMGLAAVYFRLLVSTTCWVYALRARVRRVREHYVDLCYNEAFIRSIV